MNIIMNFLRNNKQNSDDFHMRLATLIKPNRRRWCKMVGIGESTAKLWENGSYPRTDLIIKVCQKLNVSANWLLFGIGDKKLNSTLKSTKTKHQPIYNSVEESLLRLFFLANIQVDTQGGWIGCLSLFLDIDQEIIERWIINDRLPSGFVKMIEAQGFNSESWLDLRLIPNIIKFKRLAAVVGVDISSLWAERLENKLRLSREEISSILMKATIPSGLIEKISSRGIPPEDWAVE